MPKPFRVGDKIHVSKYQKIYMDGTIVEKSPIYSRNFKKILSYWYHVRIDESSFGPIGDIQLFTKKDIEHIS